MIYSVWEPGSRSYDYYQTPNAPPSAPVDPRHLRARELGTAPEDAAWPLPDGAKWVGRGRMAKGTVARKGGLGDFAGGNLLPVVGFGLAAYLLWRASRKRA